MRELVVVAGVLVLIGCGTRGSAPEPYDGHRLVGAWNSTGFGDHEFEVPLPTTDEEWKAFVSQPEATFMQLIFKADGTAVLGGMLLGHQLADKYTWEILDEEADQVSVRMTNDQGRADDSKVFFEDNNTMYMLHLGDAGQRMYSKRGERIAPVPWLQN